MTLSGKIAVVTGVTSPLGQAIALRLAAEGAAVALTGHTPTKVETVAGALKQVQADYMAEALDLTAPEIVEAFFIWVTERLGPTDVDYITGQCLYVDGGLLNAGVIVE